jgi:hypothetical protein
MHENVTPQPHVKIAPGVLHSVVLRKGNSFWIHISSRLVEAAFYFSCRLLVYINKINNYSAQFFV